MNSPWNLLSIPGLDRKKAVRYPLSFIEICKLLKINIKYFFTISN